MRPVKFLFIWVIVKVNMTTEQSRQPKRACGERKYTVQFDCGKVAQCFCSTLRVEDRVASLPPPQLQVTAAPVVKESTLFD